MWKLIRIAILLGLITALASGGLENLSVYIKNTERITFKV